MTVDAFRDSVPRVRSIDLARTVALVAMAIYHLSWDLSIFGYVPPHLPQRWGMIVFARCIAGSFIFLAGTSLTLAQGEHIRWRSFSKRLFQIVLAALLVTVATLYAFPEAYIFFGILHLIAAASVLGLLFLRLPPVLTIVIGAVMVALPSLFRSPIFDAGPLLWLGLAEIPARIQRLRPDLSLVRHLPVRDRVRPHRPRTRLVHGSCRDGLRQESARLDDRSGSPFSDRLSAPSTDSAWPCLAGGDARPARRLQRRFQPRLRAQLRSNRQTPSSAPSIVPAWPTRWPERTCCRGN